jgi:hypothetical protein
MILVGFKGSEEGRDAIELGEAGGKGAPRCRGLIAGSPVVGHGPAHSGIDDR